MINTDPGFHAELLNQPIDWGKHGRNVSKAWDEELLFRINPALMRVTSCAPTATEAMQATRPRFPSSSTELIWEKERLKALQDAIQKLKENKMAYGETEYQQPTHSDCENCRPKRKTTEITIFMKEVGFVVIDGIKMKHYAFSTFEEALAKTRELFELK